jgi:hypothetical protein
VTSSIVGAGAPLLPSVIDVDTGDWVEDSSTIDVAYEGGEDLLVSYWGYLTGGGLIISDDGFEVGDELFLNVSIRASDSRYKLRGTVVKLVPDGAKAVIAFRPGEPHDMLLSEALADSEDIAPRRFPRFSVRRRVMVSCSADEREVEIVNLSREGCCICLHKDDLNAFPVDAKVTIILGSIHALGRIVWTRNVERGIRMSTDEAEPLLRELCGDIV